ncbi:hypothetical protein [Noviherbaspirillum saxi]|uniref:PH domain-containing protein n=1 Tax=Noviherbaspirillum saxi TaxID=2320863 RepID=A0A3A3G5S1_9BURK|nr:hypothetical protein [Noviherbaspirillum saxi]RJF95530.1 hypothetical protein D3871_19215 [Noviherbaspirillum saxi]
MSPDKPDATPIALPLVLRARIPVGLLLICTALISIGVVAAANDRSMEIAIIAVIAGLIGLLQHFPGLSTLTFDGNGFVVKTIFGSRAVAWHDASNFRPIRKLRTDLVAWDDGAGEPSSPRARAQIFAYWKSVDAAALAALMNRIRLQAAGTST